MASDYKAIKANNERRYGTDVGRYGKRLLTDLYDDRTHFIYELLQNAEDALRRRTESPPSRTVRFDLSEYALRISHHGKPFDRGDVEGVCGIALGTKQEDVTQIGRFGIGFKSVYGFTERPEIHSGDEDFGIDSFVWPSAQSAIERDPDQTVFIMPLRNPDVDGEEIAKGLRRISLDTLLFLREIDTIEWSIPDGESGTYIRQSVPWDKHKHVRRVTVIGVSTDHDDVERDWLVFSRPTYGAADVLAGHVEVAFLMKDERIVPVSHSPLVVFFPTVVETNLGFRIQGPYRTTPSRDSVPEADEWNQQCVENTGDVLVDALVWLRDHEMLDVDVLRCLPIDQRKFDDESRFAPLYESVKEAFRSQELLPIFGGGYATAAGVKLARTQELRELFDRKQLERLFKSKHSISWLTDTISQDRTPDLRAYLMEDLGVDEITPQTILRKLNTSYLQHQSNGWMCRLYEFLKGQAALHRQAKDVPIIRLSDDTHVPAFVGDAPQAFLPGPVKTEFPTVHEGACRSADAKQFLRMICLSEPHLVDDVILYVLPKYGEEKLHISDSDYAADIDRILAASQTKEIDKRGELIQRLRRTRFVRAVNAGDGATFFASPDGLYLATERLKALFAGISGIEMVDDGCDALRRGGIRDLLESCGAVRHLLPSKKEYRTLNSPLSAEFLAKLRGQSGHAATSGYSDTVTDWALRGLDDVLAQLPSLDAEDQRNRARCIWEELIQLEEQRGRAVFRSEYRWTHYGSHRQEFDSAFVRQLNDSAWIPDQEGGLRRPDMVLFDSLDWRDDPFLLSKISFKRPVVEELAAEAGFEPAMLDKLKELGITSMVELEKRGLLEDQAGATGDVSLVKDAVNDLGTNHEGGSGSSNSPYDGPSKSNSHPRSESGGYTQQKRHGAAPFISYVAVDREGGTDDPDGVNHEERMALEEAAIKRILNREPDWQRTSMNNEGFDLVKVAEGQPVSWCEVKSMKGDLEGRPVGLSRAQFDCAREYGDAYWLYVVERADTEDARIVRIQNPAGKARTFTFDKGWLAVAECD